MYLLLPIACMVVGDDGVCDHFLSFTLHHKKNTNLRLKSMIPCLNLNLRLLTKGEMAPSLNVTLGWLTKGTFGWLPWLLPSLSRLYVSKSVPAPSHDMCLLALSLGDTWPVKWATSTPAKSKHNE